MTDQNRQNMLNMPIEALLEVIDDLADEVVEANRQLVPNTDEIFARLGQTYDKDYVIDMMRKIHYRRHD